MEQLAEVREYWNRHVSDWKIAQREPGTPEYFAETEAYRFEKLHYLPKLVDFAAWRGKRILDVGCGLGNDTSRFARAGAEVVGIDLAPRAVELARKNFLQRGLSGEFHVMNGEDLQFADRSFDLVYCHTVLQFTPRPQRMAEEIHRVLKDGGLAILMAINRNSWLNLLQRVMKVEVDYLDAPVYRQSSLSEHCRLASMFKSVRIVPERFPVSTKVHGGLLATVFNAVFVGAFNALPKSVTRRSGHHLIAFCEK